MKKFYTMLLIIGLVLTGCDQKTQEPTKEEEKTEIIEEKQEEETETKKEEQKVTAIDFMKNVKTAKTHQEMESVEIERLTKYTLKADSLKGTYIVFKSDDETWNVEETLGICITEDNDGLEYDNSLLYMQASDYPTFKDFVDFYYNGDVYDYATEIYYSEDGNTVVYGHYDEDYGIAGYMENFSYHKLTFTNELTDNNKYIVLHESVEADKYTHLSYEESVNRMVEVLGLTLVD